MLRWPVERWPESAVGEPFPPAALLGLVTARRDELLALSRRTGGRPQQPVILAPAIGDQKSSEVAGGFHHWLLLLFAALPLDTCSPVKKSK